MSVAGGRIPEIVARESYRYPHTVAMGRTLDGERVFIKDEDVYGSRSVAEDVYERHVLAAAVMEFLGVARPEMYFDQGTAGVYVEDLGDRSFYELQDLDVGQSARESLYDAIAAKLVIGDHDISANIHLVTETEGDVAFKPFDFDLACGDPAESYLKGMAAVDALGKRSNLPQLTGKVEQRVQKFAGELEAEDTVLEERFADHVSAETCERFWENIRYLRDPAASSWPPTAS